MKVYLVDVDNGESYEDYRHWIEKIFTTYRGASQWLINEGYKVYPECRQGEWKLYFLWRESDEYMANSNFAEIIEMELEK